MHGIWIQAIRHSGFVAFGAALLGVVSVGQQALSAPEVPQPERALEESLAHLAQPSQLVFAAPPWREELREALDPERVPAARPWPAWLAHNRPGVVYHVPPPPPARVRSHGAFEASATPGRGAIALTWEAPKLTGLDLVGYRVARRDPEGEWVEVARLGFEHTRWVDDDVAGDLPLAYRVTSHVQADDGASLSAELTLRSAEVSARALPRWLVVPRRRVLLASGGEGVYLEYYRWVGEGFVRSQHTIAVGAPIGDSGLVLSELGEASRLAVRVARRAGSAQPGTNPARWWTSADRPSGSR